MNNEELDAQFQKLYEEGNHREIIKLILSLPQEQLNDDIKGQLAVAYNNISEFDLAIDILNSLSEETKSNHTWFYKIAYAYSGKSDMSNANLNIDRALYTLEMNRHYISDEEYDYFSNLYNNLKEYIQNGSIHYEANSVNIDEPDSIIKDISSILANDIENEIVEGSILIKKWNIFINAYLETVTDKSAVINYYISSPDWDRDIFECCASAGKNANTAAGLSNGSFIFGIMTGIKAMNENTILDEVETEFAGKKHKWKVYTSNLVNMGQDNGKPKNINTYWDMFKDDILKRIGNQKICYIKIYGAKASNDYSIGELRINDVNIAELSNKMNEYVKTWNETDFSSDKQFFFLVQDNETYTPYPFRNNDILKFIQEYSNIVLNLKESEEDYDKLGNWAEKLTKDYTLATDLFLFIPEICADNEFFNELHSSEKINFNFESEGKNITVYKTQLYTYHLINNYLFELFKESAFNGKENEIYEKFINMSALYNIYVQIKEDYKNKTLENLEVNLSFNVDNDYSVR
ncbi:hypothetical protein BFL38_01000 [Brachyspira hampsonii]|uniref:Uncharacterized protein n=1 Tax=Brachyspira hampsonii TaxID=1287055 RepID=A0A1E5NAK0_9SPIR|nr:DUF6348 family protein [Brachyspira hampsonii]OEJ13182.1 hypothetical protein BFL38_01000 [Brachyspira hampsonii]